MMMHMVKRRLVLAASLLCGAFALTGCGASQLTGRVVEGPVTMVEVVNDLPASVASGVGLPGAEVVVLMDPDQANRKEIGRAMSRADGTFTVPIDAFGAGVLEHRVLISVHRRDFESAEVETILPGSNKQVSASLKPGTERRKSHESVVDETLRIAEPYMRP